MKRRASPRIIVLLVILGIAGGALWWSFGRSIPADRSNPAKEIRNVLVVSIDTCRADFLGCYNFPLETTPHIDELAADGVVFERAISPQPFTLPAHCSMLTGTIPPHHGVLDNGLFTLSADQLTLAEILQPHGFVPAAFVSSYILNSDFGLDQGFHPYDDEFGEARNTMGILERQGAETTRLAIEHLVEHRAEEQFLFVHYYDPHFTYDAPEPFGSKFASAEVFQNMPPGKSRMYADYAGEIAYVDHCIGTMIAKLKELGLYDSTLICITADHGEMLGEHGERSHGYFIYRGNIRVPLILRIPGRKKGIRVEKTVGLVDIVPTVCSALGIEIKHKIQGRDLTAYYEEDNPYPDRYLFCLSLEPTKYKANQLLGVVQDQYKYIETTHSELYDLGRDESELDNLIERQPDRVRQMEVGLQQVLDEAEAASKTNGAAGLDAETLARLESLGYVGSSVDDTFLIDPAKADPKELIDFHVLASQVGYYIQAGDFEAAEKVCRQMITERPEQYMGYYKMAISLAKQEKTTESIAFLLKMTELEQANAFAYAGLADGYRKQNQLDTSIKYALKALELKADFIVPYYCLCICYYEKQMFDEPEEHLSREIALHPRYLKLVAVLAEKLYEKGQIRRAFRKYRMILELDADSLDGLNSVAWFQAASTIDGIRNPQQAVAYAERACQLTDNMNPAALDTLAVAYAAAGDFRKAISTAQQAMEVAHSQGDDGLAGRIQKRLDLYRQGQAYLDPQLTPARDRAHL